MNKQSKYIISGKSLIVLPDLAVIFGLMDAIALQQVHYWLLRSKNLFNGRKWTYHSYPKWVEEFPFVSADTVKRTFLSLERRGVILTGNFAENKRRRDKWYSIDYNRLAAIIEEYSRCTGPKVNDTMTSAKQTDRMSVKQSDPLSESTKPETTAESTSDTDSSGSFATPDTALALSTIIVPKNRMEHEVVKLPTALEIAESYKYRWNQFVDSTNHEMGSTLSHVYGLSPELISEAADRRVEQYFDFEEICGRILESEFLLGLRSIEGKAKDWKGVTFEWILSKNQNYLKILDDQYIDF